MAHRFNRSVAVVLMVDGQLMADRDYHWQQAAGCGLVVEVVVVCVKVLTLEIIHPDRYAFSRRFKN